MSEKEITDTMLFGEDAWIYCGSHLAVHRTGWCTVSVSEKVDLGVKTCEEGKDKCRNLGLDLYEDRLKQHQLEEAVKQMTMLRKRPKRNLKNS